MTSHNSTTNHAEEELQRRPSPCYSMSSRASSAFSYIGLMGYVMPIQTLVTRSRDRARIRKKNQIDRRESLSPWVVHRKLACNWHLFFSQAIQIIHIALGNTCKYNLYIYTKCHKKIQIKKKKHEAVSQLKAKSLPAIKSLKSIQVYLSPTWFLGRLIFPPMDCKTCIPELLSNQWWGCYQENPKKSGFWFWSMSQFSSRSPSLQQHGHHEPFKLNDLSSRQQILISSSLSPLICYLQETLLASENIGQHKHHELGTSAPIVLIPMSYH